MILQGNQRGGAKALALHLLSEENDHVEVHDIQGFVANDVMGGLAGIPCPQPGHQMQATFVFLEYEPACGLKGFDQGF